MAETSEERKHCKLAIKILKSHRQKYYAAGNAAYREGLRIPFAVRDEKGYRECTEAIEYFENQLCVLEGEKEGAR